jgi:UPF0042 nucleotide-binding protein
MAASAKRPVEANRALARFVILTGLSGAGKSQAIRALEDLGYFCVDNLPTMLIPTLAELAGRAGSDLEKVAIVVDVREGAFLSKFPSLLRKLRRSRTVRPSLIFLEAGDAALVRRFSETRRPHPLAADRPIREAIAEERRRLAPIRRMADQIVDTSRLTVHELRESFIKMSKGEPQGRRLLVTVLSFGFKHGLPLESDLVFDLRFLPNPHFVRGLRALTGKDAPVEAFMESHPETGYAVDQFVSLLEFLVPRYLVEGKSYLTVSIGCTGGRHRSVYVAEAIRRALSVPAGVLVRVRHRDIGRVG